MSARVAQCVCGGASMALDMPAAIRAGFAPRVYEIHVATFAAAWHAAHVMDSGLRVGEYVIDEGHETYDLVMEGVAL